MLFARLIGAATPTDVREPAFFPNRHPALPRSEALVCAVVIDAEEDFDWNTPVYGTPHTTTCMQNIREVQTIFTAYGIVPTYLVTYPVLEDLDATRILQRYIDRGECDIGVQLHPWVTPPFGGDTGTFASYSGNLSPDLEAQKLSTITRTFIERFGRQPRIYRAGRYGLSEYTAGLLEDTGFTIDTSVAPRTDLTTDGGPDYSRYDCSPFWFGRQARLLELPLCRSIVGWSGSLAPQVYQMVTAMPLQSLRIAGLLTQTRVAERITLSPEGNDLHAMMRLVRRLRQAGERILVLSFHSSSLAVGRSPYVRNRADLHYLYDRLSGILDFIAGQAPVRFASLAEIPGLLEPPPA